MRFSGNYTCRPQGWDAIVELNSLLSKAITSFINNKPHFLKFGFIIGSPTPKWPTTGGGSTPTFLLSFVYWITPLRSSPPLIIHPVCVTLNLYYFVKNPSSLLLIAESLKIPRLFLVAPEVNICHLGIDIIFINPIVHYQFPKRICQDTHN